MSFRLRLPHHPYTSILKKIRFFKDTYPKEEGRGFARHVPFLFPLENFCFVALLMIVIFAATSFSITQIIPHMSLQKSRATADAGNGKQRGFSFAEKWIIWSVFCLLIALSIHLLLFPALQLLSWGIVRWRWYAKQKISVFKRGLAVLAFGAGAIFLAWAIALRG